MTDPRPISYYFDGLVRRSAIFPSKHFVYHFTDNAELRHDIKAIAMPISWRNILLDTSIKSIDPVRNMLEFHGVFTIEEEGGWVVLPPQVFLMLTRALEAAIALDQSAKMIAPPSRRSVRSMRRRTAI